MVHFTSLPIAGNHAQPLANTFFRQEGSAHRLGIVFPGYAYTCAMPVLYYPTQWLLEQGADVLWAETSYSRQPTYMTLSEPERLHWIGEDAEGAVRAGLAAGTYDEVLIIGKSIGTLALSWLVQNEPALTRAAFIWLTPLMNHPYLQSSVAHFCPRSLFVVGSADSLYNAADLARLTTACRGSSLVIPDADHSLEIAGDLSASLRAMDTLLNELSSFTGWR